MGNKLHSRIEVWKKLLLDFGRRNQLMNFTEGKRNHVKITAPSFDKLWKSIVVNEQEIVFPYPKKVKINDNGEESYDTVIIGNVETNRTVGDLLKTLKRLRYKTKTLIEEQGINTLYLTFGLLKWKEQDDSSNTYSSPIILVPVRLLIESLTSPYRLQLHDDEIVINPTLLNKLDNDLGFKIPDFDSTNDFPDEYIERFIQAVDSKGWQIEKCVHLTNLSFLKINMYTDLEKNEEKLNANTVIATLVGEQSPISISDELNNFDHDNQIRPVDTFQVVDADSSQQDAILLSKKGISFVLQGPPGTGKSQTITNIIAEAIADGKKILFVSEKMAALQVVYNRLISVGLDDFCLTLHSHKAKKKDILQNLEKSLNIDKADVRNEILSKLDLLERKRNLLNEYQKELHTPTSDLNVSIYHVNGELAKLENEPDIVFSIPDVTTIANDVLNERIFLLSELSKTIGKRSEDYIDNVWYNSSVKYLSNALRHEIDSNVTTAIPLLNNLKDLHVSVCSKLDVSLEPSLDGVEQLISILSLFASSPIIPEEWVLDQNINLLIESAHNYKKQAEQIIHDTEALNNRYSETFFDINPVVSKERICSSMNQLIEDLNAEDPNWLAQNIEEKNKEITSAKNDINSWFKQAETLAYALGISVPETIEQLISFVKSVDILPNIHKIRPTHNWFYEEEITRIKSEFKECVDQHNKVLEARTSILSSFDQEIFDWDFYPVLQRFRGEYNSFLRILKSQYRKDIKQLKSFSPNGAEITYQEAFEVLNTLKNISDNETVITEKAQQYKTDYGIHYLGINTQWDVLYDNLETFEQTIPNLHEITPKLKELIVQGQLPGFDIEQFKKNGSPDTLESSFENLVSLLKSDFHQKDKWDDIKTYVENINSAAALFISEYQEIINMRKIDVDYKDTISDLALLISLNTTKEDFFKQKETIHYLYKNYYNGIHTDWNKLIEALNFAAKLRKIASRYDLPKTLIRNICGDTITVSYCNDMRQTLSECQKSLQESLTWFISLFNNEKEFYQYNLLDLIDRMSLCKDKKHLLEEWVDYRSTKEKCYEANLGEYINKVEELSIDANHIIGAYLKRFYHLWLDDVLPNFPAVQNFRGRTHKQNIDEFCELDREQFKIAQARIRERALNRIPDFNSIHGANDEIAILKREIGKQRRIMPLRTLFMKIPNLITALRPCFMMSPLSVSVFLDAKVYDFDMVIFDEASQVHTEDAIGAIMRGKQIIIVGDTKQLPPTNFFTSSLSDEDFDTDIDEDTEENDAGAFDSILEEAVTVLPERCLKWHYRSRHEHLIAFSNVKIYNNQLITFPSSIERAPDCGVEYIYVKDGIYDRSGKKNNIIEARKVADLVFAHFEKHPNRSLGVVTFSEAQQNAVDAAIHQKRLQNPRFDNFFMEDKDSPFFIKNLENVQGDERDTIIFSIGYAKDSSGIMYMNFGPLNREGGYRRLNVAITRAKYNVKLVGSIVPGDIDVEKVSSKGIKMLRSYIEFAQQGTIALQKELKFNSNVTFDSPFEEAIYDFLQTKNYNVVTQVGCSGFRIDMAIKHPTQNGKFVIGIECDGATYHSSRTARERDRLRQTVLEDMGWTIYRIWSTDWIKDPKTEEEKLIKAIEQAIGKSHTDKEKEEDNNTYDHNPNNESVKHITDIEENTEPAETINTEYGFEPYKRVHPLRLVDENGKTREAHEIIWDVISLEQPIHFEELCRRVAPIFERQRATSVVRQQIKSIFRNQLNERVVVDKKNFVWIKNNENVTVRIPNPNDNYLRNISFICDKELALAMKTIAYKKGGITPEDLFIATAREFGSKRTRDNIINVLRNVYQNMIKNNEVQEVYGQVHCSTLFFADPNNKTLL